MRHSSQPKMEGNAGQQTYYMAPKIIRLEAGLARGKLPMRPSLWLQVFSQAGLSKQSMMLPLPGPAATDDADDDEDSGSSALSANSAAAASASDPLVPDKDPNADMRSDAGSRIPCKPKLALLLMHQPSRLTILLLTSPPEHPSSVSQQALMLT